MVLSLCALCFRNFWQVTPIKDGKAPKTEVLSLCVSLGRMQEELQAELIAWPEDKSPGSEAEWHDLCLQLASKWNLGDPVHSRHSWEEDARRGAATSVAPPDNQTPERAPFFELPMETPEAVPLPMKKVELAAEKRMQQKIKNASRGQGKKEVLEPVGHTKQKTEKKRERAQLEEAWECHEGGEWIETMSKKKREVADEATEDWGGWDWWWVGEEEIPKKSAREKMKKTAVARKPNAGPMGETMQAFVKQLKSEGVSHRDAMKAWKVSAERQAIVDGLGEAEKKRRRF